MKKKLQGFVAGALIGATLTGGVVLAATGTKTIDVIYNNIKVYKDNVLCELKDANGTVIEPFIYNGTTYMPVRGTANLAGMDVEWDGATKSVYLWDEVPMAGTYLLDVCPPYELTAGEIHLQSEGKSFSMAGKKYSNGFELYDPRHNPTIYFNLDSKYAQIDFTVGHVDGQGSDDTDILFFLDGKLIKTVSVKGGKLPKQVSIPVNYGLQLKIMAENASDNDWNNSDIGFGNITVQ